MTEKLTFNDGRVYEGETQGGIASDRKLPHGKGKMTWTDDDGDVDVYEGDWVKGKKHGKGKYTWADGSVYEGDYADNSANVKGKETKANGDVYEGDFVDGNPHGKGKKTFANGDVYEGDFDFADCIGKGKKTYANGDVYEGDFYGEPHGKGKKTYADGRIEEGEWKRGVFMNKKPLDGKNFFDSGEQIVYDPEKDVELVEETKKILLIFEEAVIRLDGRPLQKIIREADFTDLCKAIKAAGKQAQDTIFKNLSDRAGTELREIMANMGRIRLIEAKTALQKMNDIIRRLS